MLAAVVLASLFEISLLSAASTAQAQSVETATDRVDVASKRQVLRQSPRSSRRRSRLPAPPRRLPPNRVQPGGGLSSEASSCAADRSLTALVPVENPVYTASAAPSFLFYFPDGPEAVDYAEFTILTADEKTQVYTEQFAPNGPGIASVSLPMETDRGLEVGGSYHWYLNVHCKGSASVLAVDGWVQRVANENIAAGAAGALRDEKLPLVWYDAIAAISEDVLAGRSGRQQWESWLIAAGLAELVNEPVLGEVD